MTGSPTDPQEFPDLALPLGWRVDVVGASKRYAAIECLLAQGKSADSDLADRFLAFAETNKVRLDCLWAVEDAHGRIRASCLGVPSPGRTAMVFATHAQGTADIPVIAAAIGQTCSALKALDVVLAQTLVEPHERLERATFERAGFTHLAELSYLQRAVPAAARSTKPIEWPQHITISAYNGRRRNELLAILDASYEDTLDCPGLIGLRTTHDILEGHRASGTFDPALWTLMHVHGQPAGALLLNPSPAHETIELTYLGLAKFARGQGLGRLLLHHGLRQIAGRPERTINLAVDNSNQPALNVYRGAGFSASFRRTALILPLAHR